MKKIINRSVIACLLGIAVLVVLLWQFEIPDSASHDGDNTSMYAPIMYPPTVNSHSYTLSQLRVLEVYLDNYKESESIYDDLGILFRAEVVQDLHGMLEPGATVFVHLRPSLSHNDDINDILAAGKEHLDSMDSCFVYSWMYQNVGEETPFYNENNVPLTIITGNVLCPNIREGEFLPVVEGTVDTKTLEDIWGFPIDKYDSSFSKAKNMEDLLELLETHTDPDYWKKQEEKEYEQAALKRLALMAIAVVVGGVVLSRLCGVKRDNSSRSKRKKSP